MLHHRFKQLFTDTISINIILTVVIRTPKCTILRSTYLEYSYSEGYRKISAITSTVLELFPVLYSSVPTSLSPYCLFSRFQPTVTSREVRKNVWPTMNALTPKMLLICTKCTLTSNVYISVS